MNVLQSAVREFMRLESAGGVVLFVAAVLAMLFVNSPAEPIYDQLLDIPVAVRVADLEIAKPLLLWINDGLMAVFFFLVGLELKREMLDGELSNPSQIVLPGLAAIGGIAVPAGIYSALNWGDPVAMRGWAVPTATDIAFALGVLALLGKRVPVALKLFLLTLAIIDDLGAIVIIAMFYTSELSVSSLVFALVAVSVLAILNLRRVVSLTPYVLIGIALWIAVLKSGVHATLAGVVLAFFIPLRVPGNPEHAPLRRLEHDLHGTVAFAILPIFAFANTGVSLEGMSLAKLTEPIPLGIALGLIAGKQLGIFAAVWLGVKVGIAALPKAVRWSHIYGIAALGGIGFTMSLFIGSLAFEQGGPDIEVDDRLGILLGSTISAVTGYLILRFSLPEEIEPEDSAAQERTD